jgi:hypothetical protein
MKVVERVAAVTDRETTKLPPLYGTIDPELLDAVVGSVAADSSSLTIQFTYAGQQVTVDGEGVIRVTSTDETY